MKTSISILILAMLLGGAALAQSSQGMCLVGATQVAFGCYGNCSGGTCACGATLHITVPTSGYGSGQIYTSSATSCCNNVYAALHGPGGSCVTTGAGVRRLAADGATRLAYVRLCDGRYALVAIGG